MRNAAPSDVALQKRAKFHQDNMSKHVKIREIFGAQSPYHPNQLVAKQHMPPNGLCQKELMYRVACKISDLKVLNDVEVLAMDAWDFIRWRIGLKIAEGLSHPGQNGKKFVRTVIYKLCDEETHSRPGYEDPIMREAVLQSALRQGRLASFKSEGGKARQSQATVVQAYAESAGTHQAGRIRRQRRPQVGASTIRNSNTAAQRDEERRRRRAQLAAQSGSYQGVNAFRQMQRDRQNGHQST
jgi:hypothetical protein